MRPAYSISVKPFSQEHLNMVCHYLETFIQNVSDIYYKSAVCPMAEDEFATLMGKCSRLESELALITSLDCSSAMKERVIDLFMNIYDIMELHRFLGCGSLDDQAFDEVIVHNGMTLLDTIYLTEQTMLGVTKF